MTNIPEAMMRAQVMLKSVDGRKSSCRASISLDPPLLSATRVISTVELCESPLVGSHDLLSPRELEFRAAESLNYVSSIRVLGANGDDDLTNRNTGSHFTGFSVRTTHTR